MKSDCKKCLIAVFLTLGFLICSFSCAPDTFAAGESTAGRRLWDNIMLWVNFGIMVFFFIKYAKNPLINFLRGTRKEIEEDLGQVEGRFNDAKSGMDSEAEKLEDIDRLTAEIQERILEMGRKEKEKIIAQGRAAAEKMIEDARAYSDHRLALAKKALSDEMADSAIAMVEKKLRKGLTEEDNERLVGSFLSALGTSRPHFD